MYDYVDGKVDWLAAGLPSEGRSSSKPAASDVARNDVPTCALDDTLGAIRARVRAAGVDVCVVVNADNIVLGVIREEQLKGPDSQRADEAMVPGPSTFRPHVPIGEMAHYMAEHELPNTPITDSGGKLMGVLFREDAERVAHEDR